MTTKIRAGRALLLARQTKIFIARQGIQLAPYDVAVGRHLSMDDLLTLELISSDAAMTDDEVADEVERQLGPPTDAAGVLIGDLRAAGLLRESPLDQTDADTRYVGSGEASDEPDPVESNDIELDDGDGVQFVLPGPRFIDVGRGGFRWVEHSGRCRLHLRAVELDAAGQFRKPASVEDAWQAHQMSAGSLALSRQEFEVVLRRLLAAGLARVFDPDDPVNDLYTLIQLRESLARRHHVGRALADAAVAFEEEQSQHKEEIGTDRVRVIPVFDHPRLPPPLALGMCVAYAKTFEDGRLNAHYGFDPRFIIQREALEQVAVEPGIFLFSNYLWDAKANLELSAMVKRVNPDSLTIHGGPDTPKYAGDVDRLFRDHPDVDVAVHGEGEVTFAELLAALEGQLGAGPPDLSALAEVPGLSFRDGDRVVRTADRDRIADLDELPSPYVTGLFDAFGAYEGGSAVIETNRGCPYGCTFCDWGSATLSRIRKFDLDRVFAELEWCARNKIRGIGIADANFGIFARDIAIAEKVRDLKAEFGFPITIGANYAKNTVKHLRRIIEVLAEAEIVTEGIISLQSTDTTTLKTVNRSNIKIEKYDDLSVEFRKAGLPLSVHLMMGLPGSTALSFRADLQQCVDRGVRAHIYLTTLLTNSPMNAPDYRREHGIVALPGQVLEQTTTLSRTEWLRMGRLRRVFEFCEVFGVLRHLAMYVRSEFGIREVEFYERLFLDVADQPDRWPTLSFAIRVVPAIMAPPGSWRPFVDEAGDYVRHEFGLADDDALRTVLDVQHSLLPAYERSFPTRLDLPHDYVAWHGQVLETRDLGHHHDWETIVPPLRECGPAGFVVDDPDQVCSTAIGGTPDSLGLNMLTWEFESAVSRARSGAASPAHG